MQFFTPNFAGRDQAGLLQDAQVLHRTKTRHGQVCAQFGEALPVGFGEQIEKMAAMVIGQSLEHMFYFHTLIIRYQMVTCQGGIFIHMKMREGFWGHPKPPAGRALHP